MAWSYSGDPSSSEIDKYRFLISDTDENEPVLQDEEIQYVVDTYEDETRRLYELFNTLATVYGRQVKWRLGPQSEDPSGRQKYFAKKAEEYKKEMQLSSGISLPADSDKLFWKGIHDSE